MKKLAIPLVLLASISSLTSCATKTETPTDVAPAPQATATPAPDATIPPTVPAPAPEVAPAPEATIAPTTSSPITKVGVVSYNNPAGSDSIEFNVSVTDGVISSVTVNPQATHDISKKLQTAFAGEISSKIVGKKITELDLSAVGGASLTTAAFNTFVKAF